MKKISLLLLMLMTGMIASAQFSTDAGISALTPSGVICDGANPVIATITNYDPVNPTNGVVQVLWTIDGVPQTPVSTAGPLPGGAAVPLPLGLTQGMPGKHVITATAVYPGDVNPANDQLTIVVQVQFNGTYTIGAGPNTFPTLKMAADTLSFYGVCGSTTLNCIPGHTETSSEIIIRTTTTNASNTLTINGNGAIITAGTGTSSTVDGIIKIAGSDYVTIDGFTLQENPANTTNTTYMEWGIALLKMNNSAPFNGCHYVTIRNCTITLNKANTNTFGIYLGNHIATATTSLSITDPADANSNNSIYNNFISNTYSGIRLGGYAASSPYTLYDQNNNVGGAGGNIIVNYGGGGSTAYGINTIYQNNLIIANDSINGGTGQTTTFYGIMVSTASWANTEIYNNKITLTSASTSSNTIGIYSTAGGSGTGNLTRIYNNEIKDCNYPSTSGAFTGIYLTTPYADTVRIYNNIIKNNTLGGTGIMTLIDGGAPNNLFMYDNQVFGNTKSGASGAFYCTRASTSKIEYFRNEIYNNNIPNTSGSTSTTLYGYYNFGSPTIENYYNNSIYDLSIGGTNTSSSNIVNGIYTYTTSSAVKSIYGNEVYNLSTITGNAYGIRSQTGTSVSVFNNEIYNLEANAGSAHGLYLLATTNTYAYNNFISDIKASTSSGPNQVSGIGYASATSGNSFYAFNNSIFLNATSTGTDFGTSGIFVLSGTPAVDLRNNIVVNLSVANGTGVTAAHRRGASHTSGFSANSNNNLYYAGTPSATNLIYVVGTTTLSDACQTITNYKSLVGPADNLAVSENPPFENVLTAPYDLHIKTTVATQVESGGQQIASPVAITNDIDGDIRFGETGYSGSGMAPDLGADEGDFIPTDLSAPLISYTLIQNQTNTLGHHFTDVNITDPSGVDTAMNTRPRCYYKKTNNSNTWNDNTNATDGWKWVQAAGNSTPFDFQLDYSLIFGGITAGDTIQYFVIAADLATPNVGINSGTLAAATNSVQLNASHFPVSGTINSYIIMPSICGVYMVGASQMAPNFTNLTSAFAALDTRIMTCPVVFELQADYDPSTETFPLVVNHNVGSSAVNTVTVKPAAGVTETITGSGTAILKIFDADYFILDGSNNGTQTRDLTIENTSTATSTAIWVCKATSGNGTRGVTIKNCNILSGSNTVATVFGVYAGGETISTSGSGNDHDKLSIVNNNISRSYFGIYARANSLAGTHDSLLIADNIIGSSNASDYIAYRGMDLQYQNAPVISGNEIMNLSTSAAASISGIELGQYVSNATVSYNKIYGFRQSNTGTYGAVGINVNSASGTSNISIFNNMIYDLLNDGGGTSTASNPFGIRIIGGSDHKVYYNSVHLYGSFLNNTTTDMSACLMLTSSSISNIDVRNNIFKNTMTGGGTSKTYAVRTASSFTFGNSDNNLYYVAGPNGILGYNGSADVSTLAGWQGFTGMDASSVFADPDFQADDNLHIQPASTVVNGRAVPLAMVTDDFDGDTRNALLPDIGADEYSTTTLNDVLLLSMPSPVQQNCYSANENITIRLYNNSENTIDFSVNPATISVTVTGVNPQTFNHTVNSGTISFTGSMDVTVTGAFDMLTTGAYTINASISWAPDQNLTNNSLSPAIVLTSFNPSIDSINAAPPSICAGIPSQLQAFTTTYDIQNYVNDSVKAIPDNDPAGVYSSITVSGTTFLASQITSVTFDTILHSFDGDLDIYLYAPDGSMIELSTDNGSTGDNYIGTVFTPLAATNITSGTAPFTGQYQPEQPFSLLTGSANGTWRLFLADDASGDAGTLRRWSIQMGGYPAGNYTWWPAATLSDTTIDNPVATPASTTTYYLQVKDNNNCPSAVGSVTVTVISQPVADLGNDVSLCADQSLLLDAGNPGASYLWSDGSTSQTLLADTNGYGIGTIDYSVTVSFGGSCSDVDTISITWLALPTAVVNVSSDTVCENSPINISINLSGTGPWLLHGLTKTPAGGAPQTLPDTLVAVSPFVISDNPDTSTVYSMISVTDQGNGCPNTSVNSVTVVTYPVPAVDLGADVSMCANQSMLLDAGNPGATYLWSNGATTQTISADTLGYGLGTAMYAVTVTYGAGLCVDSDTIHITWNALPGAIITASADSVCYGDQVDFTTDLTGTGPWLLHGLAKTPAGGAPQTMPDTLVAVSPFIISDTPDTNSVYSLISVTDQFTGCVITTIAPVTVVVNPVPLVSLNIDTTLCSNLTVTLDAGNAGASYLWSTGTSTQTYVADGSVLGAGTHNISVTVTNTFGCSGSDQADITFIQAPVVDLGSDTAICADQFITLDAGNFGATYFWSDGSNGQTLNVDSTSYGLGTHTFDVEVEMNGCPVTDSINITFVEYPSVYLGVDTTICEGDYIILDAGNPGASFLWSDGSDDQLLVVDTSNFAVGTHLIYVLVDQFGCEGYDEISVTITVCVGINELGNPVTFSMYPNPSAGTFFFNAAGLSGTSALRIFDITGQEVFSTTLEAEAYRNTAIDLNHLTNGVYFVHLTNSSISHVQKIVKH